MQCPLRKISRCYCPYSVGLDCIHGDKRRSVPNVQILSAFFIAVVAERNYDPLVAELGPQANDKITDDDYLAIIRFSNGDDKPGRLKKSFLTLSIQPLADIISHPEGNDLRRRVTFRIPADPGARLSKSFRSRLP